MLDPHSYTVRSLPEAHASDEAQRYAICSASELRRKIFDPIRYIVPSVLAEGCALLAGRPKLGKSWLALEIGLAVARGSTCLGNLLCEQGDVLFLALEDNERRLQRRIDKILGTFADWPQAFQYATEWPRAEQGGVTRIQEWLEAAASPRLVVLDVLAMFRPMRSDRESSYEGDYRSLKELQALAGRFGVAILVVHHTRKSGAESGDAVEKISGTLGLAAAGDAFLVLDRDAQGATLVGRGRDVEEIEFAVDFDAATCRWKVLGKAGDVRRSDERKAILNVLREHEQPMSPAAILAAVELPSRNALDVLLHKMKKAGEIESVTRGAYTLPDMVPTPGKIGKKERLEDGDGEEAAS
jgi:hypothetical protein